MNKIVTSIIAAGLLVSSSMASDIKTEAVSHNAVIKAEHKAKKSENVKFLKEAIQALRYTNKAYIYLNDKKIAKAKDLLKKAIGELTVVLNSPNAPYLLPIDSTIQASEYLGDIKNIAKQISLAKIALNKHKLPIAREILNGLKSEIDIKTVNIPLATYPDAIKLAIKYLNENKISEAKDVIGMALNTLVNTDTIIPIPIIKANDLVVEASKIASKDKTQTIKYLDEAKRQLKIAELLGYTSKSDTTYKMLKDSINNIKNKIGAGKDTSSYFDKLKAKLKDFKEKAIHILTK
jgi:tetratricopeptide (TPR) repeat protein